MDNERLEQELQNEWHAMRPSVEVVNGADDVNISPLIDQVGEGCSKTPPKTNTSNED